MSSTDNQQITERFISLEKLIASKNKKLLRILPKFLLNRFKKLIHLDEINRIIYEYRDFKGAAFADCVIKKELNVRLVVKNPENIPSEARALVVSNHPIGSIDGMSLISVVGEKRSDILFPVNDLLRCSRCRWNRKYYRCHVGRLPAWSFGKIWCCCSRNSSGI